MPRLSVSLVLALALAVTACQGRLPATQAPGLSGSQVAVASLGGVVKAPTGVIAVGAGNVIAAGAGNHRVLATAAEQPLAGTLVYMADATGAALGDRYRALTDAQGRFIFHDVPRDHTLQVMAHARDGKGRDLALTTLVRTGKDLNALVGTATTLATFALLEARDGGAGDFDGATFRRLIAATDRHLQDGPAPDLADRQAIAARMEQIKQADTEVAGALNDLRAQIDRLQATIDDLKAQLEALQRAQTASPTPSPLPTGTSASTASARPSPTPAQTATPASQTPLEVAARGRLTLNGAPVAGQLLFNAYDQGSESAALDADGLFAVQLQTGASYAVVFVPASARAESTVLGVYSASPDGNGGVSGRFAPEPTAYVLAISPD